MLGVSARLPRTDPRSSEGVCGRVGADAELGRLTHQKGNAITINDVAFTVLVDLRGVDDHREPGSDGIDSVSGSAVSAWLWGSGLENESQRSTTQAPSSQPAITSVG
jgi:hypothetical protein